MREIHKSLFHHQAFALQISPNLALGFCGYFRPTSEADPSPLPRPIRQKVMTESPACP